MRRSGSTRKTSALKRGRASGRRTFKFPDAAPRPSHVCRSGHVVRVALQSVDQKMGQSRLAHFFSPFSGTLTVEMLGILNKFERAIVHSLLIMLMLAVLSSTVELAVLLVEQFMKPPRLFLLDMSELLPIFSFFLMVLIGVELIEVVKVYLSEDTLHVEVVFLVAMIAVGPKGHRARLRGHVPWDALRHRRHHCGPLWGLLRAQEGLTRRCHPTGVLTSRRCQPECPTFWICAKTLTRSRGGPG